MHDKIKSSLRRFKNFVKDTVERLCCCCNY